MQSLVYELLTEDVRKRITAARACTHAFVTGDSEVAAAKTGGGGGSGSNASSTTRRLPKTSSQPPISFPPTSPKASGLGGAGGSSLSLASRKDESSSSVSIYRPKSSANVLPLGHASSSISSPPISRAETSSSGDHSYMSPSHHGDLRKSSSNALSGNSGLGAGGGGGSILAQPRGLLNETDLMQSLLNINLNLATKSNNEREGSLSPPLAHGSGVLSPHGQPQRVSFEAKHGGGGSSSITGSLMGNNHTRRESSGNSSRSSSDVPSLPAIHR